MSLYKEQLGELDRGKKGRKWVKNQLNRYERRLWRRYGENAPTKRRYRYWAD